MIRQSALSSVVFGLALNASVFGEIINVPGDQPSIQAAIDAAADGDEIIVAPGTYFENINLLGKAVTLRSSDGPAVTTIDAGGDGTVVTCENEEELDTVIDGFTITGGSASVGGGMIINHSSPTVTNCAFSGNTAGEEGGGMAAGPDSEPTVTDCTFSRNTAMFGGGIVVAHGARPILTNCLFSDNMALWGAGIGLGLFGDAMVIHCTISGNTAEYGGGMWNSSSFSMVTRCTFIGNTAERGGGMFNAATLPVTNCTFSGNTAESGGGMFNNGTSPSVTNCTFGGNLAVKGGGAIHNGGIYNGGGPTITNCILWNNGSNPIMDTGEAESTVYYSDVEGGWLGAGSKNIDADPLFVDADGPDDIPGTEDDNLRLSPGSPTIDAGDSTAASICFFDLDRHERVVDDPATEDSGAGGPPVVDMGAYEFGGQPQPDCNGNGQFDECELMEGTSQDCNGNEVPDECDIADGTSADCTGNAEPDECEPDCNNNGVADSCDIADGTSEDCAGEGIPDECEPDCNENGVADSCDVADGTSEDCDDNGVPDECEQTDNDGDGVFDNCDNCNLFNPDQADCQPNGIGDVCDLAEGTSVDCDDDGIPDECGLDCNGNGVADRCDIDDGTSVDCDDDDIPDECGLDCNGNGVADSCDIADGSSEDCNDDGIPDECESFGLQILQQPVSQEVEEGELVTFWVSANGLGLQYQWRKDGADLVDDGRIIGSQGSLLIILEAESADAGEYDCVISDVFGCQIVSDLANLTVLEPCPADLSGDGIVGAEDLAQLLGSWGSCAECPADLDNDGDVDAMDLAMLLGAWGPCAP